MENSVCFTGHRPEKLMDSFFEQSEKIEFIKSELRFYIEQAITDGYTYFYSGVARGVDIFASEIVLSLKQTYPFIRHASIIPYRGQSDRWSDKWKARYNDILDKSDLCIFLNEDYNKGCLMQRNRYLVENTQRVIAVFNGEPGGTKYTISFAQKQGNEIRLISL